MPDLPPPEVEDSVRIPSGARLYTAPRDDATSVELRLAEGESRTAEVAAIDGEWVGLWLGTGDDYPFRCYPLLSDTSLKVTVWIHLRDLPVVTRELIEISYNDDNSFIILMRGVPIRRRVERPEGSLYEVHIDGIELALPLPEERLGHGFFPVPRVDPGDAEAPPQGPRPELAVGGQRILGHLVISPLPLSGDRQMAEARGECVDMLGWLTGEEGEPPPLPLPLPPSSFEGGDQPEDVRLGEGVALRWFDDSDAGVTVGEVQTAGGRFGERLCFDALKGAGDSPLLLCAAVAEATAE